MDSCEVFDQEPGEVPFEPEEYETDEDEFLTSTTTPRKTQTGRVRGTSYFQSTYISPSSRSPIQRSICSPSARRTQRKQTHCKYCDEDLPASCIIEHLKRENQKRCKFLYLKFYGVSSLESLVAKLFSCEMCYETKRINFQSHLGRKKECLRKFRLKFGLDDVKKIDTIVKNQKRKAFPSRSPVVLKSKYDSMRESKTLFKSLNEYRENTALGNYKLCIQCRANFREFGAKEVKKEDELFERFQLDSKENMLLRRFETFYLCNSCLKMEELIEDDEEATCSLGVTAVDRDVTFFPQTNENYDSCMPVCQNNVKLWYPNTLDAVENVVKVKTQKSKNKSLINIYKNQVVENSTISDLYKMECQKYKKMKEENLYTGIVNCQTNTVNGLKRVSTCGRISCSKDWFYSNAAKMKDRQDQFGCIHASIQIDLNFSTPDVIATALIQGNVPVTMEKKGLANGEIEIKYIVHLDHNSDTNCSKDCRRRQRLEDFLEESGFAVEEAQNAFTATYVSSCHQKLFSFANSIIQAPASGLFSHDYQLHLTFDQDGRGSMIGCFWPDALSSINENIANRQGEIVDGEELLKFVDQNISCSGDPSTLMTKFSLSETESKELGALVLAKQYHPKCKESEDCELCSCLPLPSMESVFKQKCSENNYDSSSRLLLLIQNKLNSLTVREKIQVETWKFLEEFWILVGADVEVNDEVLTFRIVNEDKELRFGIDSRLSMYLGKYEDSVKTGVYQYALTCCGDFTGDFIVMQRLWLVDCHIIPFNPLHLKSNKATSCIKIVNETNLFQKNFFPKIEVENHDERMSKVVPLTHRLISLAEAIAITDPQIKMVQSSSTDQFVNAKENRGSMLKRANNDEDADFTGVECGGKYNLMVDAISRHFNRQNTSDGLLLSETSCWYDFAGEEKSRELVETYRNCEIPISETPSVCSNTNLPEFILCTNGDVLMKRKKRKLLSVPIPKTMREFRYSKSILFLPIRSELELNGKGCDDRFLEIDRDQQELKVVINERKMFPKRIVMPQIVDPLDALLEALDEISDYETTVGEDIVE